MFVSKSAKFFKSLVTRPSFSFAKDALKMQEEHRRYQEQLKLKKELELRNHSMLNTYLTTGLLETEVSALLGAKHLSPVSLDHMKSLDSQMPGLLCGPTSRIVVKTVCSYEDQCIEVLFRLEESIKNSSLCAEAFQALGIQVPKDPKIETKIRINGNPAVVFLSNNNLKKYCVMGTEFLRSSQMEVVICYKNKTVVVRKDLQ